MKKILIVLIVALSVFACSKDVEDKMYVNVEVQGLKKGKFYLEKQIDSAFVPVDSATVNGSSTFTLSDKVDSPQIYYLTFAKTQKKIPFFGENDTINIKTNLDKFSYRYLISGGENQELWDRFNETYKKFNDKNLDLMKAEFQARKMKDMDSVQKLAKMKNNLLRRKYLYAINFAVRNADHEVSPFIALTELNYAQVKWLDSIYNSLTPEVKQSRYGNELKEFIVKIKVAEE